MNDYEQYGDLNLDEERVEGKTYSYDISARPVRKVQLFIPSYDTDLGKNIFEFEC